MNSVILALIAAISSSGVCSIIVYLLQRRDKKAEQALQLSITRLEAMEQRLAKQEQIIERLEKALRAQLHDSLICKCEDILTEYADGRRSYMDTDAFQNLNILYEAYTDLGGNGACKVFFDRVQTIPLRQTNQASQAPVLDRN